MTTTQEPAIIPPAVKADPQALAVPGEAQHLLQVALSYDIDSHEMLQAAAQELNSVTAKKKAITEKRLEITRPLDAAKAAVMEFFRGPISLLEQAEQTLKTGMLGYERKERERIAAEQRAAEERARKEREESERIAREAEAKAKAAQAAGDTHAAEQATAQAEQAREAAQMALVAPPAPVAAQPKASGISFRAQWKGRVTNKAALIKAATDRPELQGLLVVDPTALNAMARAVKDSGSVPGVEFYEDRGVASRGNR
jgi:hypothetical protein